MGIYYHVKRVEDGEMVMNAPEWTLALCFGIHPALLEQKITLDGFYQIHDPRWGMLRIIRLPLEIPS